MTVIAVVGDLHGRYDIAHRVLEEYDDVVFIGDYVDSFTESVDIQIKTLDLVLKAKNDNPGRVHVLIGNHERSYMDIKCRASGWNPATQIHMNDRMDELEKLKHHLFLENFLLTHAGVTDRAIGNMRLDEYLSQGDHDIVGYARGGHYPIGGLLWCDWYREFKEMDGISQVVGHSAYREGPEKGILKMGNSFNIDCLDNVNEILLIENGEGTIVPI